MTLSFLRFFFSSRCSRHENNVFCLEKKQQFQQEILSFLDLLILGNSLWSVWRSSILSPIDDIFNNALRPITSVNLLFQSQSWINPLYTFYYLGFSWALSEKVMKLCKYGPLIIQILQFQLTYHFLEILSFTPYWLCITLLKAVSHNLPSPHVHTSQFPWIYPSFYCLSFTTHQSLIFSIT